MFELSSKSPDEIVVTTKNTEITINVATATIDADLVVGTIVGAGEFEIGEVAIRGIEASQGQTIYAVEVGGVHIGIIGGVEEGLDELGVVDILCTSSIRAIRAIEPKMVVAMGNLDAMVAELKVTAQTERKLKVKNVDALPATLEVVALT